MRKQVGVTFVSNLLTPKTLRQEIIAITLAATEDPPTHYAI